MKLAELQDGWNGPQAEIDYVVSIGKSVGLLLGLANCQGIEVVGSRAHFSYISAKRFDKYLRGFKTNHEYDDTNRIFALLDRLAHTHNLRSNEIINLINYLPSEICSEQRKRIILTLEKGIASDWDLLIPNRPDGLESFQHDENTGAYLEIYVGKLHKPKIEHHYPNY